MLHSLRRAAVRAQRVISPNPLDLITLRIHHQITVLSADAAVTMVDGNAFEIGHKELEAYGSAMAVGVVPRLRAWLALAEIGFEGCFGEDGGLAGGRVEHLAGVHCERCGGVWSGGGFALGREERRVSFEGLDLSRISRKEDGSSASH